MELKPCLCTILLILLRLTGKVICSNTARVVLSSQDRSDISLNTVVGTEKTFPNGKIVREFLGIPYAQPPVGEFRFRISFPYGSLGAYFNATSWRPACVQTSRVEASNPSHEDCLYLNIWAPNDLYKFGAGYPILVAFISGGFDGTNQNNELFSGLNLAESQDIIVVTVSYRVGVFGFLRTDNNEIPGNFGLYDQKLALEWITANINDFGGDRSRITLLGNGASAATIGYLLLSNAIGNLFKWAIMHGGSPLSPWAYVEPKEAEQRAVKVASLVGCRANEAPQILASCLRSVESGKLLKASQRIAQSGYYQYLFAPTMDGVIIGQSPEILLRNGYNKKTEIMIGTTGYEGVHFYEQVFQDIRMVDASVTSKVKKMSYKLYQYAVSLLFGNPSPPRGTVASNMNPKNFIPSILQELILYEYRNWESPFENATANYLSFRGIVQDKYYNCPIVAFAKAFASSGSGAYMFQLPYFQSGDTLSWSGNGYYDSVNSKEVLDSGIQLVFGNSDNDKMLIDAVMNAWGNMTKTGNPNSGSTLSSDALNMFVWEKWNPYTRLRLVFRDPTAGEKRLRNYDISDVISTDVWDTSNKCAFWTQHMPMQIATEKENCDQYSQFTVQAANYPAV